MVAEPTIWVVDASVAFAWFAAVPGSEQAAWLLEPGSAAVLLAPDLVLVELLNAGWKCLRLGAITAEQFQMLAHRGAEPFSHLAPSQALLARAAHWCVELDHPAYDCLYVALAERERATLITADQRLLRKLQPPRPGLPPAIDLSGLTDSASAPP
ncbi:type II toxin-antitoxin system VapC family toxin [Cyanobium gracile]|uniref:Ribonuclease VapC n=1 Tax=Cyanobium gracile UHCC 0281 TaxID=3110309 RepID=A0ABU5SV39_9CYAN|nr:type II toxin-antitoxin system VapC family toxin [Cyanobium gracile]MEA5442363.1 type II toxin-antitoxin system VapC family toxin [Cyanobium gracile UHCC 0281]